jgi:hypothetical protein
VAEGEFSPLVLGILSKASKPELQFSGKTKIGSTPVLVYDYRVAKEDNATWIWKLDGREFKPGYHGRLWVESESGRLRHLTRKANSTPDEIDPWVGFTSISFDITYDDVEIPVLGRFLLPVRSELVSCQRDIPGCKHNVLTFHNCRKFAGKARIITDSPQP